MKRCIWVLAGIFFSFNLFSESYSDVKNQLEKTKEELRTFRSKSILVKTLPDILKGDDEKERELKKKIEDLEGKLRNMKKNCKVYITRIDFNNIPVMDYWSGKCDLRVYLCNSYGEKRFLIIEKDWCSANHSASISEKIEENSTLDFGDADRYWPWGEPTYVQMASFSLSPCYLQAINSGKSGSWERRIKTREKGKERDMTCTIYYECRW